MKNIYLIPTEKQEYQVKEGGLFINDTRKYSWGKLEALRCERVTQHGHAWNGTGIRTDICHLYITSDEEIKEGDWCIVGNGVSKLNTQFTSKEEINAIWKKIILTTDQDLIKDGVQAINDEFLEWFVKNPSREFVEVEKEMYMPFDGKVAFELALDESLNTRPYYKIIIPQNKTAYCCVDGIITCPGCDGEKESEFGVCAGCEGVGLVVCGKCGGKEPKQERMYSEEEVNEMFDTLKRNSIDNVATISNVDLFIDSWKKQFKKK